MIDLLIGISFRSISKSVSQKWFRRHLKIEHVLNNKYDYLIFGSSRSMYSINPIELNSLLGNKGFNSSIEASDISFFIDVLKMLERKEYTPELLIFNIFPLSVDENEVNLNNVFNILGPLSERSELFEKHYPVENSLSFINSLKFHKTLPDLINGLRKKNIKLDYGYRPIFSKGLCQLGPNCKSGKKFSLNDWRELQSKLPPVNFKLIDELLAILKKNKIKTVFTISPVHIILNLDLKRNYYYWDLIKNYLVLKGHTVLDYRYHPTFENNDLYYTDAIHLNQKGASIFTKILADDLKSFSL